MRKTLTKWASVQTRRKQPQRIVFITRNTSAKVKEESGPQLMSFPHVILRETIAFQLLAIVLVVLALFWDAPLEQLANPLLTPNPAKAPWYFLGLQELLHYFPPLVAGVLLPTLVVLALVVIPYFDINIEGEPLWAHRSAPAAADLSGSLRGAVCFARPLRRLDRAGSHGSGGSARPDSLFQSHQRLAIPEVPGLAAAAVVGDDLVHRRRPDAHGGRDFFQGPGLVLGLALEMKCLLKRWEKSQNACV